MTFRLKVSWFYILLVLSPLCHAEQTTIGMIASKELSSVLHRIEAAIYSQPAKRPQIIRLNLNELEEQMQANSPKMSLVIAIGIRATKEAFTHNSENVPIYSVLVRKQEYDRLKQDPQFKSMRTTAIYLDQPIHRQLNLINSILPKEKRNGAIAVLLGPKSKEEHSKLQEQAQEHEMQLNIANVTDGDNPVEVLDSMLADSSILLTVPDQSIYNRRTARGMLLTSYRKRVPLIGYSSSYVKNGALAAVYTSDKQVANQVATQTLAYINNEKSKLPREQFPDEFSVSVNYQVAHSMGLSIKSESALKYILCEMEK